MASLIAFRSGPQLRAFPQLGDAFQIHRGLLSQIYDSMKRCRDGKGIHASYVGTSNL